MQLLLNDRWKYEICFDNAVLEEVRSFSGTLKGAEKVLFDKEIEHYKTYFSFDQVIKTLTFLKTENDIQAFMKKVLRKKENIVFCPNALKSYYELKIAKIGFFEKELKELLNYACTDGAFPNMNELYTNIFGKPAFKKACAMTYKYAKRSHKLDKQPRLNSTYYKTFIEDLRKQCTYDFATHGVWGKYQNKDFILLENADNAKGTFKSRKLTFSSDTFIINTNAGTINERQLRSSFYFNIYPGYSHFYNNVINDEDSTLKYDNGASFLINGWATFAAWHYKPDNYTRYRKDKNAKLISYLLKQNNKKGIKKLYLHLLGSYGKSMALTLLKAITQYRGYIESYVLGCFVTEQLIDSSFCLGPADYLDKLHNLNVGDFFVHYFNIAKENKKRK